MSKLSRAHSFALAIAVIFLLPLAIPGMGLDIPYFFIIGLVLFAWFTIKWASVLSLRAKSNFFEILLCAMLIVGVYAYKVFTQSELGLLDMLILFSGIAIGFYGLRSFKLFWVPAAYGVILLLGYQLGSIVPNFVALQNWMANVMASSMQVIGINATVSGHIVAMNSVAGPLLLNVEGDCTGVQGILAFGMLSTMAVLDVKAKWSRLIPLFVIGFAGAFLINIVRLFGVFLTFEYLGVDLGSMVHVYLGYILFIVWVMVFWALASKYLMPRAGSWTPGSPGSIARPPPN